MNIFFLHRNPRVSAKAMTNKHVVKMIVESAQLLSTAHHVIDGEEAIAGIYKSTHKNHPSAKWVRDSLSHYNWLYNHFVELCKQYTDRYNKVHKTDRMLAHILTTPPKGLIDRGFNFPPLAMPKEYHKYDNTIECYRAYYIGEKLKTTEDVKRYVKVIADAI